MQAPSYESVLQPVKHQRPHQDVEYKEDAKRSDRAGKEDGESSNKKNQRINQSFRLKDICFCRICGLVCSFHISMHKSRTRFTRNFFHFERSAESTVLLSDNVSTSR